MTMRRVAWVALFGVSLLQAACNSSSSTDGGIDSGLPPCANGPSQGVTCLVTLTGAINTTFNCTVPYGISSGNVVSMVQIGAQPPDAGAKSIDITLAFDGGWPEDGGPASLIPADATSKPNSIILIQADTLETVYSAFYPDAGMVLSITASDSFQPEGGTHWCIHGTLTSPVTDLTNPANVVNLTATF
jgi:hypothetical protein